MSALLSLPSLRTRSLQSALLGTTLQHKHICVSRRGHAQTHTEMRRCRDAWRRRTHARRDPAHTQRSSRPVQKQPCLVHPLSISFGAAQCAPRNAVCCLCLLVVPLLLRLCTSVRPSNRFPPSECLHMRHYRAGPSRRQCPDSIYDSVLCMHAHQTTRNVHVFKARRLVGFARCLVTYISYVVRVLREQPPGPLVRDCAGALHVDGPAARRRRLPL